MQSIFKNDRFTVWRLRQVEGQKHPRYEIGNGGRVLGWICWCRPTTRTPGLEIEGWAFQPDDANWTWWRAEDLAALAMVMRNVATD